MVQELGKDNPSKGGNTFANGGQVVELLASSVLVSQSGDLSDKSDRWSQELFNSTSIGLLASRRGSDEVSLGVNESFNKSNLSLEVITANLLGNSSQGLDVSSNEVFVVSYGGRRRSIATTRAGSCGSGCTEGRTRSELLLNILETRGDGLETGDESGNCLFQG